MLTQSKLYKHHLHICIDAAAAAVVVYRKGEAKQNKKQHEIFISSQREAKHTRFNA